MFDMRVDSIPDNYRDSIYNNILNETRRRTPRQAIPKHARDANTVIE